MSNLWMRWIFAVVLSAMGFVLCWACLEFGAHVDAPVALGWVILPLSVVLALRKMPGRILTRADALPTRGRLESTKGRGLVRISANPDRGDLRINGQSE
jgi:hypothetical protein